MTNRVTPTPHFLNRVKPLIKKFHTLTQNLLQLEKDLIENPRMGGFLMVPESIKYALPMKVKGKERVVPSG